MKKSYLLSALQFILIFCCTALISPASVAQSGPNPPIGTEGSEKMKRDRRVSSSPIAVISNEHLERSYTLSAADLIQKMTYTPNHVVTNSTTTIRGIKRGSNNLVLINDTRYAHIDNTRSMVHTQSSLLDVNNIPIAVIEQLDVIKGAEGVHYGSDAVSGVVNFTRSKDGNTRFPENGYFPVYNQLLIEHITRENQLEADWNEVTQDVIARGKYSNTLPDDTYGENGSLNIISSPNNDFFIETKDYLDENNNLRFSVETEYYPEGYGSQETKYLDGCGNIEYAQLDLIDHFGNKFNQLNIKYTDNKPEYGYYQPDLKADLSLRELFTIKGDFSGLEIPQITWDLSDNAAKNFTYQQGSEPCMEEENGDGIENILSVNLSFRLEDFGMKTKLFPGVNASFTRACKPWIGATADASLNFGKVNETNYTIFSAYAGPTFFPFSKTHGLKDPITLSAQTLAGFSNVSQKYSGNSSSFGNFSLKLGIGGMYHVTDKWRIGLQVNDNVVFNKGNTSNNLGIDIGTRFFF